MMKKQEMITQANNLYHFYKHIFDEANITIIAWGRWFESFKTHSDVRKAYAYLFTIKNSLSNWIMLADITYRTLDPKISMDELRLRWLRIKALSSTQKQVVDLKEAIGMVNITWKQKPKRKRGSE